MTQSPKLISWSTKLKTLSQELKVKSLKLISWSTELKIWSQELKARTQEIKAKRQAQITGSRKLET